MSDFPVSDGLLERRGLPLNDGRARVREIVSRSADLPLDVLCDRLLAIGAAGGPATDGSPASAARAWAGRSVRKHAE